MQEISEFSDLELIDRINANDEEAFKILYDKYWELLFISAFNLVKNREVSEDILQDIFIDIWNKKGKIKINTSLKAYLYSSVLYKTYDYFRKHKKAFREELIDNFNKRVEASTPESKLIYKELISCLNSAIELLPKKTKVVFKLSREEQLSYKEIAVKLDVSIKTVEAHISKALRLLRDLLSSIAAVGTISFLLQEIIF